MWNFSEDIPKKIFASDSRFTFTIKGYGKALDKPSPIVPPKSSTYKSSPEPTNSKKARNSHQG